MARLATTAFIIVLSSITQAFAQSPVVAPWSDVTGEVRNYKNFRALQVDPAIQTNRNNQYAYQDRQERTPELRRLATDPDFHQQSIKKLEPSPIEAMYANRIA